VIFFTDNRKLQNDLFKKGGLSWKSTPMAQTNRADDDDDDDDDVI